MKRQSKIPSGLKFFIPGSDPLWIRYLFLDFNGTLALDGNLLPGIKPRLFKLSKYLEITILTGDTFGTARKVFEKFPTRLKIVNRGSEKKSVVSGYSGCVAMGNGRNDVMMFSAVDLSIAVLGHEGCAGDLLRSADIVVPNIIDGLDLFLKPRRLTAVWRF